MSSIGKRTKSRPIPFEQQADPRSRLWYTGGSISEQQIDVLREKSWKVTEGFDMYTDDNSESRVTMSIGGVVGGIISLILCAMAAVCVAWTIQTIVLGLAQIS